MREQPSAGREFLPPSEIVGVDAAQPPLRPLTGRAAITAHDMPEEGGYQTFEGPHRAANEQSMPGDDESGKDGEEKRSEVAPPPFRQAEVKPDEGEQRELTIPASPPDLPPVAPPPRTGGEEGDEGQGDEFPAFVHFREPFDDRKRPISRAEQAAAGARLSLFIDGLLGDTLTPVSGRADYSNAVEPTGRRLRIMVEDRTSEAGEAEYTKRISVLHLRSDTMRGEAVEYRVGLDGVARRIDHRPLTPYEKQRLATSIADRPPFPSNVPPEGFDQTMEQFRPWIRARTAGRSDAEIIGFNNQPVSLREITDLTQYVQSLWRPRRTRE